MQSFQKLHRSGINFAKFKFSFANFTCNNYFVCFIFDLETISRNNLLTRRLKHPDVDGIGRMQMNFQTLIILTFILNCLNHNGKKNMDYFHQMKF